MTGDKLLHQIETMATPALTDWYYAINADGTIQGKVSAQQLKTLFAPTVGPVYFLDSSTGDYWKLDISQDGLGNMIQTNIGPTLPTS